VEKTKRYRNLKVGDLSDDGTKITALISTHPKFTVYFTEYGKAGFATTAEVLNHNREAIERFDLINSKIFTLLPKDERDLPARQLGYALAGCLADEENQKSAQMDQIEQHIERKLDEKARFWYVATAISLVLLLIGLLYVNEEYLLENSRYFECSFFGGVGALISILHRLEQIKTGGVVSVNYVALQSFARILIGCVFGFVSFFLIKSDILFGVLADSEYGVWIAAIIAGLNERLIPETLKGIQS